MEKINSYTLRKKKIIKIGLKQLWSGSLLLLLYFHAILLITYSPLKVLGVSIISLMRSNIFLYIVIILEMSLKSG